MVAAGFLGAALQVVKWISGPIKRQFNYLCCFTSNIDNLEKEAKKLEDAEGGIKGRVDRAVDDVQVIVPQVKTWLADSEKIKGETTTILDQVPNVRSGCLKLRARFSLSKRAVKTTDSMKELREECSKFRDVSQPRPPAASEPVQLGKTYEFESRKQIEEDIMTVLRGGDVSMIGICGMGGLGKTTMAKRIMNKVLEERIFEEAVIAVVSQQVDKSKIQLEISGSLGLNLETETSEAGRKQKLRARLSGTKKILLVLDDVWKPIELEEFGIPRDSKGCTILITSRNKDTLSKMDVQKEFGMQILSEEEARFLFREKAGTCMDDDELKSIAEGIVKECKGLPIALTIVGVALKDKKNPSVWRDARRQLNQCVPDIPDLIASVYNPLKLSYDFLSSEDAKCLFLLCSLFPEDANIDVEELTYFGMGLGIFEGIGNLEGVRDRVSTLIDLLRGRSLLLDGEESVRHVRMHDVVHDVCVFIAKQKGYVGRDDCSWISSSQLLGERTKLPTRFGSPNLRLVFLSHVRNYMSMEEEEFKIDDTSFEGINDLYILCIRGYRLLTSLPTHSLNNLKNLLLDSCHGLESISVVGELVNLEILICRDCSLIEELPLEMKRLNRLKLLDLTNCKNLQRIGQGIISSLFRLEELKMLNSFNKWEPEDREERQNAGLRELDALTNLRCLEIEIEDPKLAAEKMQLSSKIKRFHIIIGKVKIAASGFCVKPYKKRMVLEPEELCLGNSIEMQLLRVTEHLQLCGNGAESVDLAKCQNIRLLELRNCDDVKNIITASTVPTYLERLGLEELPKLEEICDVPIWTDSFDNLKELRLFCLEALKELWKSSSQNIHGLPLFTNLSSIFIMGCPRLRSLGQLSIAGKGCLPQLQELHIHDCEMMERVFLRNDSESQNDHCITKVFPKLKNVVLRNLPNLATFYQGMGGIEFPLLTNLSIEKCPKLRSLGSNDNSGECSADIDDHPLQHFFCQPKQVSFGNFKKLVFIHHWNPFCNHKIHESLFNRLEMLIFSKVYGSTSLFSSSNAKNLVNLRLLDISECDELLKVIEDNKEEEDEEEEKVVSGTAQMPLILFPKLEKLRLERLPKLVTFCELKCDVSLPSLRELIVRSCPDMKNLSLGFLTAPKLDHVYSDFKHNLESEVSFDSPKKLVIWGNEKSFYGHKFFISIFTGLKELEICGCGASMSCLFTSSIARHLDSLEVLTVEDCSEMAKVIEAEDEEKVASDGKGTILFPKLWKLELINLAKLESFCEWRCDIELPSLRDVFIDSCPVLRNFTMGSIAVAPNLVNVETGSGDIDGTKDLNSVVQQYMVLQEKWEQEFQEEIKQWKVGEEQEETKGEIEEDQSSHLFNNSKSVKIEDEDNDDGTKDCFPS